MERVKLEAFPREKSTKGGRKQLRQKGFLPAVVYGRGKGAYLVTLDSVELKRALSTPAGSNVLIDMEVKGSDDNITDTVMLKELQSHPIQKNLFLHADLIRISLEDKLTVDVPLNFVGEPLGVKEGGTMQIQLREILVRCLPANIPEHIDVPVEHLKIGDVITIGELEVPPDVEILNDPSEDIASVLTPTIEEEKEEEELEEELEGEEVKEPADEGEEEEED